MDYNRDGNVVQIITGGGGGGGSGGDSSWSGDQADWATEDEYRFWNNNNNSGCEADTSYDQRQPQSRSFGDGNGGGSPPSKKVRNSQDSSFSSNRSKAIGKMFFKTKLCCKFRAGSCPYVTNCNFAHSIEELRRPPPNWQEIVAAHEEDKDKGDKEKGGGVVVVEPREEFQIPTLGSSSNIVGDMMQRSSKGRHCKKFFTEEGCPYGESCTFLHDEQSKNRESVAISLGPGGYAGGGGGSGGASAGAGSGAGGGNGANLKPSNWKTRICNKWEITGYCPFGNKCHFAHGTTELHRFGGGLMEGEIKDTGSAIAAETKQGGAAPSKTPADNAAASVNPVVAHSDVYHIGVPSQRPSSVVTQRPGQRTHKWKGPDKISRIYGDWIDDIE